MHLDMPAGAAEGDPLNGQGLDEVVYSQYMKSDIIAAIAALAELPDDRQAVIARAILDYAAEEGSIYRLDDMEQAEVVSGLNEIARGDYANNGDVAEAHRRLGG